MTRIVSVSVGILLYFFIHYHLVAQNFQVHYDIRHTLDPEVNAKNYPSMSFEYFRELDSLGSFLFKAQSDFSGENYNMSQTFIQLTQAIKFWEPKVYLSLNYSGGHGIAQPSYGYYLHNAYGLGLSYPFQWLGGWFNLNIQYRYTALKIASHDIQLNFYFWKGFFNYRLVTNGSIVMWTENKIQGAGSNSQVSVKKFAFFGDPQVWIKVKGGFSFGSRINLYCNLIGRENSLKVYPTIGIQYKF